MEFIQDLLTAATQVIAIAGFTGIALHAMWKHHTNWMAEYCPPVKPYTPDTQVEVEAKAPVEPMRETAGAENTQPEIEDIWEAPITSSSARYWIRQPQSIKPTLMLVAAKEKAKPVVPTRTAIKKSQQPLEVNLNSLDSAALRKLCSQHGIQWRDARGKGKHLTKAVMVFQLEQKATA